jgi:hypothetical protein
MAIVLLYPGPLLAAPSPAKKKPPLKVKFGVYITHIFDINFVKNQYNVQFWSWFHHNKKTYKPNRTTEIMNARQFSRQTPNEEFVKGIHWDTALIKASIKQNWDVKHFPFDTQTLQIHLEDVNLPVEKLQLIPDTQASKMDPKALPPGWEFKGFRIYRHVNHYQTAFGDPAAKSNTKQSFSRITVSVVLKRKGWRLFFITFTGFFVACALVLIVFFLNSFPSFKEHIPIATTIALCTGALFAAVGGIYVVSAKVPYTTDFTLADSILISSFVGIAFAMIGSVATELLSKMDKQQLGANLNRILFGLYLAALLIPISFLMTNA